MSPTPPALAGYPSPRRIVVVGGGIAGLSATYHLQEFARAADLPVEITLVERDTRLGGKVVTAYQDGFVVEGGPDSFLTQKPWAVELCHRLGLGDRLIGTNEARRQVFILWQGKLRPLPDGVLLIVPTRLRPFAFSTLLSPLGKLRMALDLIIPPRQTATDESVAHFVRRRLGQEALDKIAEPLMGGIHTSDPERQSLLATFPRFADIERKYGSLIRGMLAAKRRRPTSAPPAPMFMSLRGGLQELVDTLVAQLGRAHLLTQRQVLRLQRLASGAYRLHLDDGAPLEADAVVLAVPARVAAGLLRDLDVELAARLAAIRYVSTASVSFGYRSADLGRDLDGFGFVVPGKERRRITGCTWTSTKFEGRAPTEGVLLRVFLGSVADQATPHLPEDELVRVARAELRAIMGITVEPILTQVYRWPAGHPQYDVGHLDRLAEIDRLCASHPGLYLTGSSYRGVGLPDCIHNAALVAEKVIKECPTPGLGERQPVPVSALISRGLG